jgi:hypothetical protein
MRDEGKRDKNLINYMGGASWNITHASNGSHF